MNAHRPFTFTPAIAAGLTLVIGLAVTGLALGDAASPPPPGAASHGRATAALPLQANVPVPGAWTYTGSLNQGREAHTATLLQNGQVLAAGGFDGSGRLASAELYNPVTGTWSTTGSLNQARAGHTATLLQNGQVLVAGGCSGTDYCETYPTSAELYDPATGVWTTTGNLHQSRIYHTATLLGNGKVLVAGGEALGTPYGLTSAELYHPATGTWTYTGSMHDARYGHTATMLPSGQVLVAGGEDNGWLASAELYEPVWGLWTPTGSLNTARGWGHTATLLQNGQVLVAGGCSGTYSCETYLASAELYDPATWWAWTPTGSLNDGRAGHTATLLDNGKVLAAGGCVGVPGEPYCSIVASAQLYSLLPYALHLPLVVKNP